ncbi:MAG: circadian clock protein KaiC [Synergistales bacterium]|nr:circadian clock protein KaiC [Synergistales bacterium]
MTERAQEMGKLKTGIQGFDLIAEGGLPQGRTTLFTGTAGSCKTLFACQFVVKGIADYGEPGVLVTFEEAPEDISRNVASLGWDLRAYERQGTFAFVDASPQLTQDIQLGGAFDLGGFLARVENAIARTGAKRVSIDSLGALFTRFDDPRTIRNELFRLHRVLKDMGVTAVLTAERADEYGQITRYGIEEFVADNVVILRNNLEGEKRRRTAEILKFRGTEHQKGEFPFSIISGEGIVVVPISAMELRQRSSDERISSGNAALDKMCGGGFFKDSVILVSGATGTGKTLMVTEFISDGASRGKPCVLFAFEESREQLFRNARGWGHDFEALEKEGKLKVVCEYPEVVGLEERLIIMKDIMNTFQPSRVAVDSLSALERVGTRKGYREFVIALTSFIKHQEITGLFTSTSPSLIGGASVTEGHISTLTDTIILLRYVELYGEMRRGITTLKMRGSQHDKDIKEFLIDSQGMHVGEAFRNVVGILAGNPSHTEHEEMERFQNMFGDDRI